MPKCMTNYTWEPMFVYRCLLMHTCLLSIRAHTLYQSNIIPMRSHTNKHVHVKFQCDIFLCHGSMRDTYQYMHGKHSYEPERQSTFVLQKHSVRSVPALLEWMRRNDKNGWRFHERQQQSFHTLRMCVYVFLFLLSLLSSSPSSSSLLLYADSKIIKYANDIPHRLRRTLLQC